MKILGGSYGFRGNGGGISRCREGVREGLEKIEWQLTSNEGKGGVGGWVGVSWKYLRALWEHWVKLSWHNQNPPKPPPSHSIPQVVNNDWSSMIRSTLFHQVRILVYTWFEVALVSCTSRVLLETILTCRNWSSFPPLYAIELDVVIGEKWYWGAKFWGKVSLGWPRRRTMVSWHGLMSVSEQLRTYPSPNPTTVNW